MSKDKLITIADVTPEQILLARRKLELKQSDVAKAIELNVTTYGAIEKGQSDPKLSNYRKIISFFEKNGIVFCAEGKINFEVTSAHLLQQQKAG